MSEGEKPRAHRIEAAALLALVIALPLLAAALGSQRAASVTLNLGPGDGPYVRGFLPEWEIDDRVATHWTSYDATVELPLAASGGPATLAYRFARVLPETAVVQVFLGGRPVDRFDCRGGRFEERRVALGALAQATPLSVRFEIDSHDQRRLGLRLDWVRLEAGRFRLTGAALPRPAALAALIAGVLSASGWGLATATRLALVPSALLSIGLLLDPWLVLRLLTGLPEALALVAAVGLGAGRLLARSGRVELETIKRLSVLCLAAFLIRAAAVNHPDFYYPDLKTHSSLVRELEAAGLDFLWHPAKHIASHGLWKIEAHGRVYAFPYSPAFHVPFALLHLPADALMTAMKLSGAAVSLVPLVLVWVLARGTGAAPLAAFLMLVIPTYTSRLSFAFLPALFGHAFDTALVCWLAGHLERVSTRRAFLAGACLIAACQLAYVSGVINTGMLILSLALVVAAQPADGGVRRGALIAAMGLMGALLAVFVYYRDFLPMALNVLARATGQEPGGASRYPIRSFSIVAFERTRDFFGYLLPALAAIGLLRMVRRRAPGRAVLLAVALAYGLLLLGRAKLPDLFLHGHETLFLTPLVCLAAGEALEALRAKGPPGRAIQVLTLALLAVWGLREQWLALAVQLRNAR